MVIIGAPKYSCGTTIRGKRPKCLPVVSRQRGLESRAYASKPAKRLEAFHTGYEVEDHAFSHDPIMKG